MRINKVNRKHYDQQLNRIKPKRALTIVWEAQKKEYSNFLFLIPLKKLWTLY